MNINMREAQPDDVRFVFPLIYSAGPHEFDYVFNIGNQTFHDYFTFAFPTKFGSVSYRIYTVAIVDNQVVGVGAFYCGKDYTRLALGTLWNVLRFYGPLHLIEFMQRSVRLATILPPPDADAEHIEQVGVKEEFRGCGIGTALLQHQIGLARTKRLRKCTLDVATTNPQAQKLYERLGFKVVMENKWKYPDSRIHVPNERRMELVF